MSVPIKLDELGVFADKKDTARVDSRYIAKFFNKDHAHVLRDIQKILSEDNGLSKEFRESNFGLSSYKSGQNKKLPCYQLTRDGFTMLVMGYTGKRAMQFKEMYIQHFNKMEAFIATLVETRQEFPLLTEQIKFLHENPRPYHFSNEADLLNRIVLGMTAKQFREANGIEDKKSIRPYLTHEQLDRLDTLQKIDIGLLVACPSYSDRKQKLEWYAMKHFE